MRCGICGLAGAGDDSVSLVYKCWGITCRICLTLTLCWLVLDLYYLSTLICRVDLHV